MQLNCLGINIDIWKLGNNFGVVQPLELEWICVPHIYCSIIIGQLGGVFVSVVVGD